MVKRENALTLQDSWNDLQFGTEGVFAMTTFASITRYNAAMINLLRLTLKTQSWTRLLVIMLRIWYFGQLSFYKSLDNMPVRCYRISNILYLKHMDHIIR